MEASNPLSSKNEMTLSLPDMAAIINAVRPSLSYTATIKYHRKGDSNKGIAKQHAANKCTS